MNRQWKHRISITGFQDAEPGDYPQLSQVTYEALKPIDRAYPDDEELGEIYLEFRSLALPEYNGSVDAFDDALGRCRQAAVGGDAMKKSKEAMVKEIAEIVDSMGPEFVLRAIRQLRLANRLLKIKASNNPKKS